MIMRDRFGTGVVGGKCVLVWVVVSPAIVCNVRPNQFRGRIDCVKRVVWIHADVARGVERELRDADRSRSGEGAGVVRGFLQERRGKKFRREACAVRGEHRLRCESERPNRGDACICS